MNTDKLLAAVDHINKAGTLIIEYVIEHNSYGPTLGDVVDAAHSLSADLYALINGLAIEKSMDAPE